MKVENPLGNGLNKISTKQSGTDKTVSKGSSFSEVLEQAKSSGLQSQQPVGPLGGIPSPVEMTQAQKHAISKGEEALNLLGHLASLLERPFGNSSMESVAGALDSSSSELLAIKSELEQGDPLIQTMDEIAVLSVVEKIKIMRGDYT